MTKREKHLHKALVPVRFALKGWAFSRNPQGHVAAAEREVAKLPEDVRADGEKLVQAVRDALTKEG